MHLVVWPDEMVYTAVGQLAVYNDILIPLFVSGYMQMMEAEKPATRPLMANHLVELMGELHLETSAGIPCSVAPAARAWQGQVGR